MDYTPFRGGNRAPTMFSVFPFPATRPIRSRNNINMAPRQPRILQGRQLILASLILPRRRTTSRGRAPRELRAMRRQGNKNHHESIILMPVICCTGNPGWWDMRSEECSQIIRLAGRYWNEAKRSTSAHECAQVRTPVLRSRFCYC